MNRLKDTVLLLLFLGIVVQAWAWIDPQPPGGDSAVKDAMRVGDSLPLLRGYDRDHSLTSLQLTDGGRTATAIYVYHPDCGPCGTVAPGWARHFSKLAARGLAVRMIALTQADFPAAHDFADSFDWRVEILSVDGLSMSIAERYLISKTPWVFVFDSNGVLRLQNHGAELDPVEATLAMLSQATTTLDSTKQKAHNNP